MDPFLYQPHPASLRQYAEWFRAVYPKEAKEEDEADRAAEKEAGKRTRDGIRALWEKYKKQHAAGQVCIVAFLFSLFVILCGVFFFILASDIIRPP